MFNKIFFFKIYFENKRFIILFSHRLFNEILNNWNTIAMRVIMLLRSIKYY